jgi:hypothetical protein
VQYLSFGGVWKAEKAQLIRRSLFPEYSLFLLFILSEVLYYLLKANKFWHKRLLGTSSPLFPSISLFK